MEAVFLFKDKLAATLWYRPKRMRLVSHQPLLPERQGCAGSRIPGLLIL